MEQDPSLTILFVRFETQPGLIVPVDLLEWLSALREYAAIGKSGANVAYGSWQSAYLK